jgi:hypothetical protein
MNQTLQKIRMIVLVSLLTMLSSWSVAQVNVAPLATASASTCNTGACSTLNDLNFGTCGTQQMWISSSATNPGSSIFIQFTCLNASVISPIATNTSESAKSCTVLFDLLLLPQTI